MIDRSVGRTARNIPVLGTLKRLAHGERLAAISREYQMSHQTLSNVLRRTDEREYQELMSRRTLRHRILPDVSKIWKRLECKESIKSIADEYNVSKTALSKVLRRINGERYEAIMSRRTLRQKVLPAISGVWRKLESGMSLESIAKKFNVFGTTLSRVLREIDRKRYKAIMSERALRTPTQMILPTIAEVWKRLERGDPVIIVAESYKMNRVTFSDVLLRIDRKRYEKAMSKRREKGHLARRGEGTDSLYELEIKRTLEQQGISFESHVRLKKCQFVPDFKLGNLIIEAAGLSYGSYWKHYKKKVRSYAKLGLEVLIVVPDHLQKKAEEYLGQSTKSRILASSEFKTYARGLKNEHNQTTTSFGTFSLKKMPR